MQASKGHKEWWLLTPCEIYQSFKVRKLNQQAIILMHLMIIWKYSKLIADTNVAQIIIRFGYSLFGKAKSGLTKVEKVDHMPLLQTEMP